MAFDLHARFHETWLGMVQPVEGLVVSIPVLVEAQCMERHRPELQERFQAACPLVDEKGLPIEEDVTARTRRDRTESERKKRTARRRYRELGAFLEQVLGWTPDLYDRGEAMPRDLARYISEGHQTIRPTLAVRRLGGSEEPPRPVPPLRVVAGAAEASPPDDNDGNSDNTPDSGDDEEGATAAKPSRRSLTVLPDIETPESLAGRPY